MNFEERAANVIIQDIERLLSWKLNSQQQTWIQLSVPVTRTQQKRITRLIRKKVPIGKLRWNGQELSFKVT